MAKRKAKRWDSPKALYSVQMMESKMGSGWENQMEWNWESQTGCYSGKN